MVEEDEYACVSKVQLKIKDNSGIKKKKKKKKANKETEKVIENEVKQQLKQQTNPNAKTKAELAFQKMQEKMVSFIVLLHYKLATVRKLLGTIQTDVYYKSNSKLVHENIYNS